MTKISNLYSLTNYITANTSGNIVISAPSSGYALDVTGTGRFTGDLTIANATANNRFFINRASSAYTSGIFYQTNGTYDFLLGQNPLGTGTSDLSVYSYGTSSVVFNIARATGNVGIGTTSPSYKLSVQGPVLGNIISWTDAANNTGYLGIRATAASIGADNNLVFETAATERMRITSGGSLLINRTSNPYESTYKCIINNGTNLNIGIGKQVGEMSIEAFNDAVDTGTPLRIYGNPIRMYNSIYFMNYSNGSLSISGNQVVSSSDKNLKIFDGNIENALDKISKLTPKYFYWKEDSGIDTRDRQLGFYAQDVKEALGEEVANDNGSGKWGIYDRGIVAMLTKAVQELKAELDTLKNK